MQRLLCLVSSNVMPQINASVPSSLQTSRYWQDGCNDRGYPCCCNCYSHLWIMQKPPQTIGICSLNMTLLTGLEDCMQCCGPKTPQDDWNHACLHPETARYSCGQFWVPNCVNHHNHDPGEIVLCHALAKSAAEIMSGVEINESEGRCTDL